MHPKSPKWIEHIADAGAFIREATAGRSLAEYEADRLLPSAIECQFRRRFGIHHRALPSIGLVDLPPRRVYHRIGELAFEEQTTIEDPPGRSGLSQFAADRNVGADDDDLAPQSHSDDPYRYHEVRVVGQVNGAVEPILDGVHDQV
jgi:hypothetical protein